jgi:hypothetical protein
MAVISQSIPKQISSLPRVNDDRVIFHLLARLSLPTRADNSQMEHCQQLTWPFGGKLTALNF